jgi:glycosyltransferase involved in cell wall biosynthesis
VSQLIVNLSVVGTQPTGIATYAQNIIAGLQLPELALLTPYYREQFAHIPCHFIPNDLSAEHGKSGHLRRLLWTQFQLPKFYRKLRSRLIFSPVPEAPLLTNCRSVVMVHDFIPLRFPNWKSPLTYYSRYYVPLVLSQAKHIICNSEATANDITHFFKVPARKITPILLAHDANHFRPLPLSPQESLNQSPYFPYFLYLGRHDPYKNLHRLIASFASLSTPDCELWFAGPTDPRYTPKLKQQAEALGVSHRIKFLNYVEYEQLPVLLYHAIALVFPSLWEGFGFPALEAMACGTPVITSNLASLPEVVGDAALLIDPYNEAELTAAMQTVLEDASTRSQLQTAGLARASQFSWQSTAQETVNVLEQFL